ncbi:C1 family peptidase [candidate division WOR-3 bacterium]|nr:C1 family peptidase [candidate division WOR-3 bacterium]
MKTKMKFGLCILLTIGVVVAQGHNHRTGLILEDLSKTAPEHQVKSVKVAFGSPSFSDVPRVDLSDEVPPIGNQGNQGSCVSWATAYYHRSQLEYRERHWDLTDPHHQFSPAFVYNQVNGGADLGSGFVNASLVCEQGCASMADCPYSQMDYVTWPSESAYSHAIPFRCQDWAWFDVTDTIGLNVIKQLLCNGSSAVLTIKVWGNFDNIQLYNNTYCASDRTGNNRGGHGVCVVGYDDTLTTNDGPGAFRLTNSWGTGWGDVGFWWMSYAAVLDTFLSLRLCGFLVDTVGYEPRLLGRARIEHPTRDRVGIKFSVGSPGSPLWSKEFRNWREAVVDHPFPANSMVFDLTEGADYIAGGQAESVSVACVDAYPDNAGGTLQFMSGQYLPWQTVFASEQTPVVIPDRGFVHAGVRIQHCERDAGAGCIMSPCGIVEPDSSYMPTVELWNCGESLASFRARLTIGSEYTDSVVIQDLGAHDSVHVEFGAWTAPVYGTHLVRCSTALDGDEYYGNDVCSTFVRSRWHDVQAVEILAPTDTVDSGVSVRPWVRVRNNGTQPETFIAWFRIPDEGYNKPAQLTVPADTTADVGFSNWSPSAPGYHAMSCTLVLGGDQVDSNDVITGGVFVFTGIAEGEPMSPEHLILQTVNRGVLVLPWDMTELPGNSDRVPRPLLLDISGRNVLDLHPGANDVRALAPGVYFVREGPGARGEGLGKTRKIVVTR